MAAQSMALASMDVYATLGGDLRTICFPVVGGENTTTVFPACLHVIEGNKEDGVRELGIPSSLHCFCEITVCVGEWESDFTQNRENWVSECVWLWILFSEK